MDLSVIIVSWNVREKLKSNLEALLKSRGDFSYEIYVVDNSSADGTEKMIREEFIKSVKFIAKATNLGFAKANNEALRLCVGQTKYTLLLNPDMKVYPDTLDKMIKWMDGHKEAAIAGCRLFTEDGKNIGHVRRFPTIFNQLAIIFKLPHFFPFVLNRYLRKDFNYDKEAVVDSIRGSFFMIRAETLKRIGLLDENYFLWFEEVDYCRRAKLAGLKVMYTPAAQCLDLEGASFSQVRRGKTQKYFRRSMLIYFKKWHPRWQYFLLKVVWPIGMFLTWAGGLINFKSKAKT